jgi:response regulator of citrate/malate metabolism
MSNNKNTRKIDNPKAYNESGIKDTMEDLENTTKAALHSAPEVDKEVQIARKQRKRYCMAAVMTTTTTTRIRKKKKLLS